MRIEGNYHPNLGFGKDKAGSNKDRPSLADALSASTPAEAKETSPSLIEAAFQTDEVNQVAVEAARQALANGELDSPDAARRAAEAILDRGI